MRIAVEINCTTTYLLCTNSLFGWEGGSGHGVDRQNPTQFIKKCFKKYIVGDTLFFAGQYKISWEDFLSKVQF